MAEKDRMDRDETEAGLERLLKAPLEDGFTIDRGHGFPSSKDATAADHTDQGTAPRTYKELESVEIPEAVPELGVKAGDRGVIATVWDGGRMLDVEVPKPGGTSAGFVDIEVLPDGAPHCVLLQTQRLAPASYRGRV